MVDNGGDLPSDYESEDSIMAEWENIHNKVIFDCLNEMLDSYRPYGLKGPPLPWSQNLWTLTYKYSEEDWIDEIFSESREKVLKWATTECGTLSTSPKLLKTKHDYPLLRGLSDVQLLNHLREEQLANMLQ